MYILFQDINLLGEFEGIEFVDGRWPETPYAPYNRDFRVSPEVFRKNKNFYKRFSLTSPWKNQKGRPNNQNP